MNTHDPLSDAFDLLKARSCERAACNLELEERMMQEFAKGKRRRMSVVTKVIAVALLCVTAGAAVAATGGLSRLLNWSGTVETLDGTVYDVVNGQILDDNGNVIGTAEVEIGAE
jgi:hypothetical protein